MQTYTGSRSSEDDARETAAIAARTRVRTLTHTCTHTHTHTCVQLSSLFYSRLSSSPLCARAQVYDRKRFTDGGFNHYDLYFPDGSCPRDSILLHFLELAEAEAGALAVRAGAQAAVRANWLIGTKFVVL